MDWSIMFESKVVVFGCGNICMGDDGVGPAVIQALEKEPDKPADTALIDIGTAIRNHLFDLIVADKRPERIIIVDAVTEDDREPGDVREVDVDHVDPKKVNDFSMHLFPTVNLLKDLKKSTDIDVKIVTVQTKYIPEEMEEGLTDEMKAAIPEVVERVKKYWKM